MRLIFNFHPDGWRPKEASAKSVCPSGCALMALFFPRACCARVIYACQVESMQPAVTAHALWLGVPPCLVAASGGPVAGLVLFVCK
jgi:hypothetical protein